LKSIGINTTWSSYDQAKKLTFLIVTPLRLVGEATGSKVYCIIYSIYPIIIIIELDDSINGFNRLLA